MPGALAALVQIPGAYPWGPPTLVLLPGAYLLGPAVWCISLGPGRPGAYPRCISLRPIRPGAYHWNMSLRPRPPWCVPVVHISLRPRTGLTIAYESAHFQGLAVRDKVFEQSNERR